MTRSPHYRWAALLLILLSPGCALQSPAAPDRGKSPSADLRPLRWPERRTADLDAIIAAMPHRWSIQSTRVKTNGGAIETSSPQIPMYDVLEARKAGVGIIRKLQALTPEGHSKGDSPVHEFLSFRPGPRPSAQSAREAEIEFNRIIVDRREIKFLPPLRDGPPRGLLVYIEPLFIMPGDAAVVKTLRQRGWMVVEVAFVGLTNEPFHVNIDSEADIDSAAVRIAERSDAQLARCAYAVEAALDYLAETQPDLPKHPLVAAGFSAGALALSTVLARMPDRFDAAVYTTGGAPLLDVSQNSTMSDGGLKIYYKGGRVPPEIMKKLRERYLHHSGLDAYHAAPHLHRLPILMLHGVCDTMVPAFTGDTLYERLGKPERWVYLGGHIWVFTILPLEAGRIADWIDQHVPTTVAQPVEAQ